MKKTRDKKVWVDVLRCMARPEGAIVGTGEFYFSTLFGGRRFRAQYFNGDEPNFRAKKNSSP